mmetsp:Transcript_85771/g.135469  ORF Transcript_85771/g.135469 Transcript_85771/m.135469 type:complete len:170 (+) Transcript_85771:84-593(+)
MRSEELEFDFDRTEAGASATYPQKAGKLHKGDVAMLKGRPCKILNTSTSQTGKHGHAKVHFWGTDLFTAKKYEELCQSAHDIEVPFVKRAECTVSMLDERSGAVSVILTSGEIKSDLNLPAFVRMGEPTEDDLKLQVEVIEAYNAGKIVDVVVLTACGEEKIVAAKFTD